MDILDGDVSSKDILDEGVSNNNEIIMTDRVVGYIKEIGKWAYFLSIIGFILLGLLTLVSFYLIGIGWEKFVILGIGYLCMVALYFFPNFYLFKFAKEIKSGLNNSIQSEVDSAFENLKRLFKFTGILTIIIVGIYLLAFVFGSLSYGGGF